MNVESMARHGWVLAIQATLLLVLGFAVALAFRKRGAAWQTNILRTTLAATLALFLIGPFLGSSAKPVWTVPTPAAGPMVSIPVKNLPTTGRYAPSVLIPPTQLTPESPAPASQPNQSISLRDLGVLVWAGGAVVGLVWILLGIASLALIRMRRQRSNDASLQSLVRELSQSIGVREPRLVASPRVVSPFISGVFRPTIFLPDDSLQQFDTEQLRAIVAHELIHIRHRDCFWGWMARIVSVVAWPHPMIWMLRRKLHNSSEELCDQVVLQSGLRAANYADCLLRIANRATPTRTERLMGVGVVPIRSTLGRRISLVLDTSRNTVTRVSLVGRLAIACSICFALAAIAVAIAPHEKSAPSHMAASQDQPNDPAAAAVAKAMRETYANLTSFSADLSTGNGPGDNTQRLRLIYSRPGYAKVEKQERDRMEVAETLYVEPEAFYVTTPHHPGEYLVQRKSDNQEWQYQGSLFMGLNAIQAQGMMALAMLKQNEKMLATYDAGRTPWMLGPDVKADGVACKTLVTKFVQPNGNVSVQSWVVGMNDHLVRESKMDLIRNGTLIYETLDKYTHVRTNFPVDESSLKLKRNPAWKEIVKPTFNFQAKLPPAVEAMDKTLHDARSISFVVEEVSGEARQEEGGKWVPYTTLNRLTVEVVKPDKAHVKLELKDYPRQNLEVWARGTKEQIVEKGNTERYIDRTITKDMDLFAEVGIPAGACNTGFSLLQQINSPRGMRYFNGIEGQPTTLEGEPCNVVVQKQMVQDQFGFPTPNSGATTLFISERDHMLRRIETRNSYSSGGKTMTSVSTETIRNLKIDSPIPDAVFTFKPEPGMKPTSTVNDLEPYRRQSETAIDETLAPGQLAPDFKSTFINGVPVSLSQYKGKVVFLHGWTLGIQNYEWDLPKYEKIYRKFKDKGLVMLGIPYESNDDKKQVTDWLAKHSITHPQVFDGKGKAGGVQSIYKMGGRPFVFIIDRQGTVYAKPTFDPNIEKMIQAALDRK